MPVGTHQLSQFTTPNNGEPNDAEVVKSHLNSIRSAHNAHDNNATVHIQSSTLASRPAAGTAGRVWVSADSSVVSIWYDNGSSWELINDFSSLVVGTDPTGSQILRVGGDALISGDLTVNDLFPSGSIDFSTTSARVSFGSGAGDFRLRIGGAPLAIEVVRRDEASYLPVRGSTLYGEYLNISTEARVGAAPPSGSEIVRVDGSIRISGGIGAASGALWLNGGAGQLRISRIDTQEIAMLGENDDWAILNVNAVKLQGSWLITRDSTYSTVRAHDGDIALQLDDDDNYYNGNVHYLRNRAGSSTYASLGSNGLQLNVQGNTARYNAGSVSGSVTLDWNNGNVQRFQMTGNVTSLTLNNPRTGAVYVLELLQDGAGSRTVTWPGNVIWAGGSAPTLTTSAGRKDVVTMLYNGTNYLANVFGKNFNDSV